MRAIAFQPIVFESPIDPEQKDETASDAANYFMRDIIQIQFQREESENLACGLVDQSSTFEMIANGTFETDLSSWDMNTPGDWTFDSGGAKASGNNTPLSQVIVGNGVTIKFRLTYDIIERTVGTLQPLIYTGVFNSAGVSRNADGSYSEVITALNAFSDLLRFAPSGGFDGKIDNVSLRPVVEENDCFTFPNWEFTPDGLIHTPGSTDPITFVDGIEVGKHYKLKITSVDGTAGHAIIKNGTTAVSILHEDAQNYYFIATDTGLTIEPSSDYDGTVISLAIYELETFQDEQIFFTDALDEDDASFETSLHEYVRYDREWATLSFAPNPDPETDVYEPGCFYIKYYPDAEDVDTIKASNKIRLAYYFEEVGNLGKKIEARCDGEAYDFLFDDFFTLMQRLPVTSVNSSYPRTDDTYTKSNGRIWRQYSTFSKKKTALIGSTHEIAHDCLAMQLLCDHLEMDEEEIICDDKDYTVDWPKDGSLRHATASFDYRYKPVLYNRNLASTPPEYLLRVLHSWDTAGQAYKTVWQKPGNEIDAGDFDFVDGQIVTFRLDALIINGVSLISTSKFISFSKNGGVVTPELTISTGINNNTNYDGGHDFIQNVDEWINAMITGREVQFHDGLSVVEYLKGSTFYLELFVKVAQDEDYDYGRKYFTDGNLPAKMHHIYDPAQPVAELPYY